MVIIHVMSDRTAALTASMTARAAKSDAAKAKRRLKRSKKGNAQAELHVEWSTEFRELFGKEVEVPKWGPAERSLAKKLIGEIGFDEAHKMVRQFVSNWRQRPFDGVPSMRLMWAMRQRLLAEMSGAVSMNAKRDRLMSDEWEEGVSDGPSEGWG